MRPTALIADDEPALVAMIEAQLRALWPELEIAGTAPDGDAALALAEATRPLIAFLDIQMPGASGLEVARRLSGKCHVVFVTAHDRYAVQAFESAAVDYLLKPVDDERLARTIARLKRSLAAPPADLQSLLTELAARLPGKREHLQWLQVDSRGDLVLVPVEEVALFASADKYTLAVTRDAEWVIRTPLKDLEEQLDPARFWRVHRNTIVRVAAIERVRRDERGELVLLLRELERTVRVSRAHAHLFRQM